MLFARTTVRGGPRNDLTPREFESARVSFPQSGNCRLREMLVRDVERGALDTAIRQRHRTSISPVAAEQSRMGSSKRFFTRFEVSVSC